MILKKAVSAQSVADSSEVCIVVSQCFIAAPRLLLLVCRYRPQSNAHVLMSPLSEIPSLSWPSAPCSRSHSNAAACACVSLSVSSESFCCLLIFSRGPTYDLFFF